MNSVVTVGTFDGIHCGHKKVLEKVLEIAQREDLSPVVVTFDRHPLEVVSPDRAPKMVMDTDSRDLMLHNAGVTVKRVHFTNEVRRTTAAQWMRLLRDEEGMKVLVLGYDNTFGSDGSKLSFDDYRSIGDSLGVRVVVAEAVPGCSSSAVRMAVAEGDVKRAEGVLGRPFSISGEVIHGRELGRTIGVPTANLRIGEGMLLPKAGVYSADVNVPGRGSFRGVVNVGDNPTVESDGKTRVEAHIIDFSGDIYGHTITLEFRRRIRDERRFASLADLREQIGRDIAASKA